MMVDVDYLSRIHNDLVKAHGLIANQLSLVDRSVRPGAYSSEVLATILQRGKYLVKLSDASNHQHLEWIATTFHTHEKYRTTTLAECQPR